MAAVQPLAVEVCAPKGEGESIRAPTLPQGSHPRVLQSGRVEPQDDAFKKVRDTEGHHRPPRKMRYRFHQGAPRTSSEAGISSRRRTSGLLFEPLVACTSSRHQSRGGRDEGIAREDYLKVEGRF